MELIDRGVVDRAIRRHRDAGPALLAWIRTVEGATWQNLADVRRVYPPADGVAVTSGATVTVFNVRGNNYRLLTVISYRYQQVRPIDLLTHAEYDKDRWKERL